MDTSFIIKLEEKILKFWKERDIFNRTLAKTKKGKPFVFWDGPPTANGKPGIHHVLGRSFKDLFPRYQTMKGRYVLRKAGWDTHGLPVEIEVEKKLGLKSKKEIEAYGIGKFNDAAKESVWEYKTLWENFSARVGFWLDTQNPYITYTTDYVESLWHIIKQFDDKKLLYEGHKVLPWCPRCGTALSSHELAQGYKEVTDTSVTWKFKVKDNEKTPTYLLAWTTTPWSTLSTMGLSVGPTFTYIKAKVGDEYVIVVNERAEEILRDHQYEVVEEMKGSKLVGLEYEPVAPWYKDLPELKGNDRIYHVYAGDYVEVTEGTGLVTINGSYGEVDMEAAKKNKLPVVLDVDQNGLFNDKAGMLKGMGLKDGQKKFIEDAQKRGLVWRVEDYTHTYPHCWRCKTPLIYYARHSWFVAMSTLRNKLIANNSKVNWVPEHLRDGRFGEFLREVKDWAFSRERYWGTPLPVWECESCTHRLVAGSIQDLETYGLPKRNTFKIVRHGFSTKNSAKGFGSDTISSRLDDDTYKLTPKGIAQAKAAGALLKKQGGVDVIVSSPFLRTKETARIIAAELDLSVEYDDRLKEFDHGSVCEGKAHKLCPHYDMEAFDVRHDNGETRNELRGRMVSLVKELDAKYEGKRILLVSHGDPIWFLRSAMRLLSDKDTVAQRDELFPDKGEVYDLNVINAPFDETGAVNLHRPYVDDITLQCEKCEHSMRRVSEVVDVWFDSGAMPYAQWHYPFENKDIYKKQFPGDFIVEGIDQTRGWFYTLLAISTALGRGLAYKNVVSYGLLLDKEGKKMSKSVGNVIDPWDVLGAYGADATRWYFYTVNSPGDAKLFDMKAVEQVIKGFLMTLHNVARFYELYEGDVSKKDEKVKPRHILDRWIWSRFNSVLAEVTKAMDVFEPMVASRIIDQFVAEDVSNWWLRRSRERFQRGSEDERKEAVAFFRYLMLNICAMIAPFTPFIAEHLYKKFDGPEESVHLVDWPKAQKRAIDEDMEKDMQVVRDVVAAGLAARQEANLKVRQPLAAVYVQSKIAKEYQALLKDELNVKIIEVRPSQEEVARLETALTPELIHEGMARDITRSIQELRKAAGYDVSDKVRGMWKSDDAQVRTAIEKYSAEIAKDAVLSSLEEGQNETDQAKDITLGKASVWLGVKK